MTQTTVSPVVEAIHRAVPEVIGAEFGERADLGVLASRVAWDACRYFGVAAKPVVVRALALNQAWLDFTREAEATDPEFDRGREWYEDRFPEGAWSVAADERDHGEAGRFPGHVVLVLPDDGLLLDVTAAQFSRPERNLVVPDTVLMPVDAAAFLAGQGVTFAFGEEPNLSYLAYCRRASAAKNFRAGSDWRCKQPYSGRVIRRVREETQ